MIGQEAEVESDCFNVTFDDEILIVCSDGEDEVMRISNGKVNEFHS